MTDLLLCSRTLSASASPHPMPSLLSSLQHEAVEHDDDVVFASQAEACSASCTRALSS